MIPDYGKIHTVGHRDIRQLFDGPVVVQEKIDGSQFSAMLNEDGILLARSKGGPLDIEAAASKGLFAPSLLHLISVRDRLTPGAIYRFEAMNRPKHNVLAYARIPKGNLVLYDVQGLDFPLEDIAERLGVEPVQELFRGQIDETSLTDLLKAKPQLGGAMIEGVVIKNYVLGLKGKFVAPRFQEIMHNRPPRAAKESPVIDLGRKYRSEARWEKAISHLREEGKIGLEGQEANSDIGLIIREVQRDILEECGDEIRQALFSAFAKDLRGAWISGLPDWYQARGSK